MAHTGSMTGTASPAKETPMTATTKIEGRMARCGGLHHTDRGEIVLHDACHARVAKREDGRLFTLSVSYFRGGGSEGYACWSSRHVCDPAMVELVAKEKAEKLAGGELVKGATVKVVKGRKVPKGTVGVVFWMGESGYGKTRLGIRDAAGETHWVPDAGNVEVMAS